VDGCELEVLILQIDYQSPLFDEHLYKVSVRWSSDPDICPPLSAMGIIGAGDGVTEITGGYLYETEAIVRESEFDPEAIAVRFTLTSSVDDPKGTTRSFELSMKRPE
jgi:hypothetical protein